MRRYIAHIQSKEPHERRRHALQVAGVLTGLLFVGWISTLGMRVPKAGEADPSLTAAAAQAQLENAPHLEVSQTSVYAPSNGSQ